MTSRILNGSKSDYIYNIEQDHFILMKDDYCHIQL